MSVYWSTYVQTSEELYASRALRFRHDNSQLWLDALGAENGMKVLETGCGGGVFCHRIKEALPECSVTGTDLDAGHIAFAQRKSAELGMDCTFLCCDACAMPFKDASFDLAFSHTVMCFCDPDRFAAEQYRVLRDGGRMTAMDVINRASAERWLPENPRESELFGKLWEAASQNEHSDIPRFADSKRVWAESMKKAGFKEITFKVLAVVSYCPDSADVSRETAMEMINEDRLSALSSAQKARIMAPGALTEAEYAELESLINARYDERIALYDRGEKLWDYGTSTVIAVTGVKPSV